MRLFWKLLCSTVLIAALALSLGGYVLIYRQFEEGYQRDVGLLLGENDFLRYAMGEQFGPDSDADDIETAATRLAATADGEVSFSLYGSDGELLVATEDYIQTKGEPMRPNPGQRIWELRHGSNGSQVLVVATAIEASGANLILENQRDISDLYAMRDEQFGTFLGVMGAAVLLVGALSILAAQWITRPLRRLSVVAREIAGGDLTKRADDRGDDELADLSRDFNLMVNRVEGQIKELADAAQRQEDFVGAFSHEIKTPLTSILGHAELMESRPDNAVLTYESAGYILREGKRLEALSRKLMDIVVLDGRDFAPDIIDAEQLIVGTAGSLAPALKAEGVVLTVKAAPAQVKADADLMGAVCANLIDNSRKAVLLRKEADGTVPLIILSGYPEGDSYILSVEDNGLGIPANELGRITEAFYKVDKSRSRAQGGAGLGLAICERIVSLHGGSMDFESDEGAGTAVRVRLPLKLGGGSSEGIHGGGGSPVSAVRGELSSQKGEVDG